MSLLRDSSYRLLLRAATRKDAAGFEAYQAWRRAVPLDDVNGAAYRIMPMLVDTAQAAGGTDPDIERMRGVWRHIWVANTLRLKQLFLMLDGLEASGIEPLLLKGAALFAREPKLAAKRVSGDYDLLVREADVPAARRIAEALGLRPAHLDWAAVDDDLIGGATSGVNLADRNGRSTLDLHWRALPNFHDPALTEGLFARSVVRRLQGREIRIPSATDHVFLAVVRAEPHEPREVFTRLLEGHLVLGAAGDEVDWDRLIEMLERSGFTAVASEYFALLTTETPTAIRPDVLARLRKGVDVGSRLELWLRRTSPHERSPIGRWWIGNRDSHFGRIRPEMTPTVGETVALAGVWGLTASASALWRGAKKRVTGRVAADRIAYPLGWHYAETDGRWSDGPVAVITVPAGRRIRLAGHLFAGGATPKLLVSNGRSTSRFAGTGNFAIEVDGNPQPELGGATLLLLWCSKAGSPSRAGGNKDERSLGVFIRSVE